MAEIRFSDRMRERLTLSFEVFPPKTEKGMKNLPSVIDELKEFHPDYISCTYGAGGSNTGPNREVLRIIAKKTVPCTHFTCIGVSKDRFEIAVAAAPGGHVDCVSEDVDISYLKMKQDLGADYIITQLCYDLEQFKVWRDKVDKAGITMPIDVGIMPVTTKHGILTQCFSHNACAVPRDLALVLTHHWFQKDPDGNEIPEVKAAFREEGLTYSADLLNRYLPLGINGIHLYALNRAADVREVLIRSGFGDRFRALL